MDKMNVTNLDTSGSPWRLVHTDERYAVVEHYPSRRREIGQRSAVAGFLLDERLRAARVHNGGMV